MSAKIMKSKPITVTQPAQWVDAWRQHMDRTGRENMSAFIAEAVNKLIEYECKRGRFRNSVRGERGAKGIRPS
jgi:hypothetical protein